METKDSQKPHINVDYFEDLTGDIDHKQTEGPDIGNRIRMLREEKGLTLEELSRISGCEIDFLADIESGKSQPQLGTAIKLSKALDSALGGLISGPADKPYSITRKAERKSISRSTAQKGQKKLYAYKSLAPEVKGRHMEALMVQLEENPDEETSLHDGEEFIYVLEGVVVLKVGEDQYELEPGDSAYYISSIPHLIAAKEKNAMILAVLYEG